MFFGLLRKGGATVHRGYFHVFRKIFDNPINQKSEYFHVFVNLLGMANHSEKIILADGRNLKLVPGQLLTSRKVLSEKLQIPRSTLERILKYLENGQLIGQQKTNKYRVITVLGWEAYQQSGQQSGQQMGNRWATDGHKQ